MSSDNVFRSAIFILLLVSSSQLIFSQEKPVVFEHITTRDGLSQNNVHSIFQDQKGFIWLATEDGVNRYDGYNFTVYKNRTGDSLSLSDNYANAAYLTRSGDYWVGTQYGGLNKYNASNDNFYSYLHDYTNPNSICSNFIISISEDTKGNLWIGSAESGFDYFDLRDTSFTHSRNMLPSGYEIENDAITFIHQDNRGRLWIGGINKIHLFNIEYSKRNKPELRPLKLGNQYINSIATCIEEDSKGNIWIGTVSGDLLKYEADAESLVQFDFNYRVNRGLGGIRSIESYEDKMLWIAVPGTGIINIDLINKEYETYASDPLNESSLNTNNVISIFRDRTGVLWVGTITGGINKYDPSVIKFSLYKPEPNKPNGLRASSFRGFYVDDEELLWICGAGGGLNLLNRKTDELKVYLHDRSDNSTISSNNIRCIYEDNDNTIWVGTNRGLNKFNRKSKTFQTFFIDPVNPTNPVNNLNYTILQIPGKPDYLWFGTDGGGLIKFDKKNETIKSYTYDPESETSLNNRDNFVRTLFYSENRPDELWLGTTHGINIFNLHDETFRYYEHDPKDENSLSNDNVMHIYEDESNIMWIGTYGGGLNRFDPKTELFTYFTENNSDLPSDVVYAILPDKIGNLWLSTNNGLSRFNIESETFRNYTVDDGLQGEEFNGGSHYLSRDGEMFFGGVEGFNSFYPNQVEDNPYPPAIAITDLKIFDESLEFGTEAGISQHIVDMNEINLEYWQNDLSFEFVALHYARSSRNKYAFMLENYDKSWKYSENIRSATYTNLDPGEYVFRVKGSNNDGIWNEEGKSLRLVINPPWWKTNPAYISYFILFVLGIFAIDRVQRARVSAKERHRAELAILEAENERKSHELEEARNLQLSMLPKELPQLPNLDIAVYMKTATEVGGDYYDFHVGLDGTLTVVLGDATGHGMKAGTMVTSVKSLFNVLAPNPDIVMTFHEITRCIKLMRMEKLSMCMSLLKISGNKLQMSAAGMPPIFIYKNSERTIEEHVFKGMPLGTMDKFPYDVKETELETGDTILMMSDGFPELMNASNEIYGYKRARNKFEEVAEGTPEQIIDILKGEGSEWINNSDPDDDVTFVVMKVK